VLLSMPGTLQRLFKFAKATSSSPLENLTTEAVAVAIRAEPRVFISALSSAGLIPPFEMVELGSVETQVPVPDGIVDLVVELMLDGLPRSFWVDPWREDHDHLSSATEEAIRRASRGEAAF
jgi:hypothetical protein